MQRMTDLQTTEENMRRLIPLRVTWGDVVSYLSLEDAYEVLISVRAVSPVGLAISRALAGVIIGAHR